MMSVWTVNGAAIDDYGIQDMRFRFRSMAADECDIEIAIESTTDPVPAAFEDGAEVSIEQDGVCVFRGRVESPENQFGARSLRRTIHLLGPFWYLEKQWWLGQHYYMTGPTTLTQKWRSRGDLRSNTNTLIRQVLERGLGCGKYQIGTIDVSDIEIPGSERRSILLSSALAYALQWAPHAITYFDYRDVPPSFHAIGISSPSMRDLTFTEGVHAIREARAKPLSNLILPSVRLEFERNVSYSHDGTTITGLANEGLQIYPQDVGVVPGSLICNILLQGTQRFISSTVACSTKPITYYLQSVSDATSATNKRCYDFFRWYDTNLVYPESSSPDAVTISNLVYSVTFRSASTIAASQLYPVEPGQRVPDEELYLRTTAEGGIAVADITASADFMLTYYPSWGGGSYRHYNQSGRINFVAVDGGYRGQVRSIDVTTDELVQPSANLAQQLYESRAELMYKGRVVVHAKDPWFLTGPQRKIQVQPHGWSGLIQSMAVNAFSGVTTVEFGTAEYLGPEDLLALAQLNR